jgi:hypothetical protein
MCGFLGVFFVFSYMKNDFRYFFPVLGISGASLIALYITNIILKKYVKKSDDNFTDHYTASQDFPDISGDRIHNLVNQALEKTGWKYEKTSDDTYIAKTKISLQSWGETITIEIKQDKSVYVKSNCRIPTTLVDWGKNKQNVELFFDKLNKIITESKANF